VLIVEDAASARHRIVREDRVGRKVRGCVRRHVVADIGRVNCFRLHDVTRVRISRRRDWF
jgi:hypothetical protein